MVSKSSATHHLSMTHGRGLAALIGATLMLAGCGDDAPSNDEEIDAGKRAPATLRELHRQLGPTPTEFTIDGATGGMVRGESVRFEIAAGAITDRSGTPIAGPVTISLREFQSVGDAVRGNRPTMEQVEGLWLESSGAFELDARDAAGGSAVIQDLDRVGFNRWPNGQAPDRMRPWVAGANDDAWIQPRELAQVPAEVSTAGYFFNSLPFGSIGSYTAYNCDAVVNLSVVRTTLRVQLPPALTDEAGVFFLPDGVNTAAKLYTRDPSLPGFVSYQNTMPVGVRGKLVVVALADGKYHLFHDDAYVIPAGNPVLNGTEATILVTPLEVSELDFNAYMNSL